MFSSVLFGSKFRVHVEFITMTLLRKLEISIREKHYIVTARFYIENNNRGCVIRYYYSTITSFYYIRTRERAKYESVLHCSKRIAL